MLVSVYSNQLSLFNAHAMILIFHIVMNVNKLCLNEIAPIISVDSIKTGAGASVSVKVCAFWGPYVDRLSRQ